MPTIRPEPDADVVIVGLGPVGQLLAVLLARLGHRVIAIEERPEPYLLPRAVHYDPDVSRALDGIGLGDVAGEFALATSVYEWQNADRQTLLRFPFNAVGDQGWPESSMFTQPTLEHELRRRALDFPSFTAVRGARVLTLSQTDDRVDVETVDAAGERSTVSARFVIGCDGADSSVRDLIDSEVRDLGFFYDWLICDIIPTVPREWVPENLQVCDPARPTTVVSSGPGRRRFEFMRMPIDDLAGFDTPQNSWALMEPWGVTPENAILERSALYTFQALWATRWRDHRVLLAGDAAHLMPPFFGQGLVSGIRDAMNLAWKLDLVLAGVATPGLLDSYESERSVHVQHAIAMSVELGKVICETDPDAVAARDAHFLAVGPDPARALPPVPPERLGPGAFLHDELSSMPTGVIGVNGRVRRADGTVTLLDRLTFGVFTVLLDGRAISPAAVEALASHLPPTLGIVIVRLLPVGTALPPEDGDDVITVTDEDGRYLPRLRAGGSIAEVVRPDFMVYGAAATEPALHALVESLSEVLGLVTTRDAR